MMENISLFSLLMAVLSSSLAVQLHPRTHSIPKETESVNGSRVDGGCEVDRTMGLCGIGKISFLTDGNIPVFNITDSNWASELVTVRKNNGTAAIPYNHVILTFVFQKPQLLKSVKLNLFKCPQWGVGAPNITVYGEPNLRNFLFDIFRDSIIRLAQSQDVQSSCNSLVPVTIPLQTGKQYQTWYIVVSFEPQPSIDWVHVGEVQFFGTRTTPPPSTNTEPTPSMDSNSEENENTTTIAAGIVASIVILILILTVIFSGFFLLQRRQKLNIIRARNLQKPVNPPSKKQEECEFDIWTKKEPAEDSKAMQQDNNNIAAYSTNLSQSYNGSIGYTEVPERIVMKEEDSSNDDNSLYDDIAISSVMKASSFPTLNHYEAEAPTHSAQQKLSLPKVQPKSYRSSENLHGDITAEDGGIAIYSDVKKEIAPDVPSKSPALEMYLITRAMS